MFILKNAWISIVRNKGRNILIGIIIFIIACASTITLAIKNTASDLIESYDKEVTISFNRANVMKDFDMSDENSRQEAKETFSNIATYTIDDVKNYADSEYVTDYYYTYKIYLNGKNIEKAESTEETIDKRGKTIGENQSNFDFNLSGYSTLNSMSEFINGTYTMKEITDDAWDIAFSGNYVFINEELANYNDLKLNDKITLEDENNNSYEFIIIGIYTENISNESLPNSMFSNSANTIITNADVLIDITSNNSAIISSINPTFIINSYDNVNDLQSEFYEKGLAESYTLETNESEVTNAVASVKNVNSFATTFLVITLIIGGTTLFIINMINIRERKYEIGVLRTIGISKFKLTMQFVLELLIVSLVSLLLGAIVGSISAKSVGNYLLTNEIENSTEKMQETENNFGRNMIQGEKGTLDNMMVKRSGVPSIQAYDSIDAVVDVVVIFELLVIGLSLVLISSISAMISIQRFSPLTILKERS